MIVDSETNFLYFSSLIKENSKYRSFWQRLEPILVDNQINYGFIENTRDIWCRDYMPVQADENRFIQFEFHPDYCTTPRYMSKLTLPEEIKIQHDIPKKKSKVIIDGGNLVKSKSSIILTDKIFKENPSLESTTIIAILRKELGIENIFIIPQAPFDITGHADGMVRFLNETDLLVADYSNESLTWRRKMDKALEKTGLKIIPFPSEVVDEKNEDGDYVARGVYINFAQIENIILFPQFGLETDAFALMCTKDIYSGCIVIPIYSNELAVDGGVLNCITWNIKTTFQ